MEKCLFCQIGAGEIPAKIRFQNNKVMVFDDINPKTEIHLLIIPKTHIASVNDASQKDQAILGQLILTAQKIAGELKIRDHGYRLVINVGKGSGQMIDHLHVHLLAGKKLTNF